MAGQLFDFEKYYTEKNVKTEIHLDVSGINLKTSGSIESDDDTVTLNQYITNNVMYKVSRIVADGVDLKQNETLHITIIDTTSGMGSDVFTALGYSIDDLDSAGVVEIPETTAAMGPTTLNAGLQKDGLSNYQFAKLTETNGRLRPTNVSKVVIYVVARFRLMNPVMNTLGSSNGNVPPYYLNPSSDSFNKVDQNFAHMSNIDDIKRIMGAIGFYGKRYMGFKWYGRQPSKNPCCVWRYDAFRKRLKYMSDILKDNGIGIGVTYYGDDYADPIDDKIVDATAKEYKKKPLQAMAKHKRYVKALIDSDWTRTNIPRNGKFKEVYGGSELKNFIDKANKHGVMNDISGDKATALIPNMADLFKRFYYDAEQLAEEFNDRYFTVYKGIMGIRGVSRFMSSKLRKKLTAERLRMKVPAVRNVGGVSQVTEELQYAVDLASFVNVLRYQFTNGSNKMVWAKGGSNDVLPRAISNYNEYVCNGSMETDTTTNKNYIKISNYTVDGLIQAGATASTNKGILYKQTADRLITKTSDYKDWVINTEEKSSAEIMDYLAEVFTETYNNMHDLDEDDAGYCVWTRDNVTINYKDANGDIQQIDVKQNADGSTAGNSGLPSVGTMTGYANSARTNSSITVPYGGSARQFQDFCFGFINAFNSKRKISVGHGAVEYVDLNMGARPDKVLCVCWDASSTPNDVIAQARFEPEYKTINDIGEAADYEIDDCLRFVDTMGEAIDSIDTILNAKMMVLGLLFTIREKIKLSDVKDDYADLKDTIRKIKWYQMFTNESVFDNKSFIGTRGKDDAVNMHYLYMPARLLIPVEMYKRVKVKYKRFGFTRHKMVKRSIGVRWAEVKFVDNEVYSSYPMNNNEPRQFYPINQYATLTTQNLPANEKDGVEAGTHTVFTFDNALEGDTADKIDVGAITQFTKGELQIGDKDGYEYTVFFKDSQKFTSSDIDIDLTGSKVFVYGIYVPLEPTQASDDFTPIRVEYKMPYLPYDSEIKRWAFMHYGAFDQSKYAEQSREVPAKSDRIDGWTIFKPSSKRIGDLRAGLGIYDAVAILMGILRNAYGTSRVDLIETMRSLDDQETECSGEAESKFLSWHNYGLAVKILINDAETGLPIADGSEDMRKLIDIAEAFTTACYNGAFGKPLNVIWCGRLVVGANIFVWEFLPIGVNHKDAPKFREELLNQGDPIATFGYVNVDAKRLVYKTAPVAKIPYVLESSNAYQNAVIINGEHYVAPANIRNYRPPHDLVLINVLEFVNLIDTKMGANGSTKTDRNNMYEWKALNDKSYLQLITYFAMTGNVAASKTLIGGDYVERYQNIVDSKYSEDYVAMVKDFLGEKLYKDIKIYIVSSGDGGAWLSLADGKIHIKVNDIIPNYNRNSKGHFFGEKQMNPSTTLRGRWINGLFYTEEELEAMGYQTEIVSSKAFIQGYDNQGNVEGGDAMLIHSLIATQIKNDFNKIRERFEQYGGSLMYDHFIDGPNANDINMLENEFGIIEAQDLISFDKLRNMYKQNDINDNAHTSSDGTLNGAGANEEDKDELGDGGHKDGEGKDIIPQSIYEKVVSNAMLSGVRKASLTKEHVEVNARVQGATVEQLYRMITQGRGYKANDILKH